MRAMKSVGIVLAVLVALVLLYQASRNGRYYPMPVGSGPLFVVMDTRTGAWELDSPSQKDIDAVRRRISQ
jgi:streptogramin lyase